MRVVGCQFNPDGEFSTLTRPNPQYKEAFEMGIEIAADSDVIIATDPDADRMGIAVKDKNSEYSVLTGNQIALISMPPRYLRRTSGTTMEPSARWFCSTMAGKIREVARPEPFRV